MNIAATEKEGPPPEYTPPPAYSETEPNVSQQYTPQMFTFPPPGSSDGPPAPPPGGVIYSAPPQDSVTWQGQDIPLHVAYFGPFPTQGGREGASGYSPPSYSQLQFPSQGFVVSGAGVYVPPPSGSEYGQPGQTHVVFTEQPQVAPVTTTITVARQPKPQNWLMLSIITCMCFSPLFGLIAICFSVASTSAYDEGDHVGSARYGRTALVFNVFGIVLTVMFIVMMVSFTVATRHQY